MAPEGDIEGGQLCYQNQVYKLVNTQSFDEITAANNVRNTFHHTFLQVIKKVLFFNKYSNHLKFQIVEKPSTTKPEPQTDMAKKCKCLEQFGNLG